MKGIIFTTFIDLVEEKFGMEMLEDIISISKVPNAGSYTSVGTYDHSELLAMVKVLSEKSTIPEVDLIKTFGEYLFGVLSQSYANWLKDIDSAFDLLEQVDGFIHVEVKKLYPDAEPPGFDCRRIGNNQLEMIYHSPRNLGDVAEGLILGCAKYYQQEIGIKREVLGPKTGHKERFLLTLQVGDAT